MFDHQAFKRTLLEESAERPAYAPTSIAAVLAVAMMFDDDETILMIADGYASDRHLDAEDQAWLATLAAEIRIGEPQGSV